MNRKTFLFVCFAAILSTIGCAFHQPTGPEFKNHAVKDKNNALLYFYRTKGESFGYDRPYFVAVNRKIIGDILHGSYIPYEIAPGHVDIVSDLTRTLGSSLPLITLALEAAANPGSAKLSIEAKAGETYFIRMRPETRATHFVPHLTLVPNNTGRREIDGLKLAQ